MLEDRRPVVKELIIKNGLVNIWPNYSQNEKVALFVNHSVTHSHNRHSTMIKEQGVSVSVLLNNDEIISRMLNGTCPIIYVHFK